MMLFLRIVFLCCLLFLSPHSSLAVKGPVSYTSAVVDGLRNNVWGIVDSLQSISSSSLFNNVDHVSTTTTTTRRGLPLPLPLSLQQQLPILQQLRGGEVLEPETLGDVESLLIKAGSESKLVVIDFTATWCGPCKMIAPLFKELSDQYDDVIFLKVDVDENPDTAAKYGVSAMPTFIFIKYGEVIDKLMGANPAQLQELIEEHK